MGKSGFWIGVAVSVPVSLLCIAFGIFGGISPVPILIGALFCAIVLWAVGILS